MVFDVAHISLPYNVILGYPALAQFMAVAHHGYNLVKIPGSNGTITIRCDEANARKAVEHVYKAVAAASLDEDDLPEHTGGFPSRRATDFHEHVEHTGGSPSSGACITPYSVKESSHKLQGTPQQRPTTSHGPSPVTSKPSSRNGSSPASSSGPHNLTKDFNTTRSSWNRSPCA